MLKELRGSPVAGLFPSLELRGLSLPVDRRSFEVAEAIASKDSNSLYITSTFFCDRVKYEAFCANYAIMRVVDDRVDAVRASSRRDHATRQHESDVVTAWEDAVLACSQGTRPSESLVIRCQHTQGPALLEVFRASCRVFPPEPQLWKNFFKAMRSDLTRTRFTDWQDFLEYAEGASVAPTTIYLSLILANGKGVTEPSKPPVSFDLYACGRHLGVFAYLGHIVRDLGKDIRNEGEPLLYFTEDDMRAHGVSLSTLTGDAARGLACQRTRQLVGELLSRGRAHLKLGRRLVKRSEEQIGGDSRFILELIITLYEMMITKIIACGNDPMGDRHWLTEGERTQVVHEVAARTGYILPETDPTESGG